ncbi:hypothetical protein ACFE04_000390 [Oxalis oulophora]
MNTKTTFLFTVLLIIATSSTTSLATRPDASTKGKKGGNDASSGSGSGSGVITDPGMGGFYGGSGGEPGFNIPGLGPIVGGGYGGGYGGPSGGYGKGGIIRPTITCKEKGPCYGKKLTCPKKCFSSYHHSGKGGGGGGGGGGCSMDCKKKCVAYC